MKFLHNFTIITLTAGLMLCSTNALGRSKKKNKKICYDKETGLKWYAGPDKNIKWSDANAWVKKLSVDGGGWRMPTPDELKNIYKSGAGKRNIRLKCLKTTGWYLWSGLKNQYTKDYKYFNFSGGGYHWLNRDYSKKVRVFAVRSPHSKKPKTTKKTKSSKKTSKSSKARKAIDLKICYDKNTNLEWCAGPNRHTSWKKAKAWVKDISYDGWRMPTLSELKGLYKEGAGKRNIKVECLKTGGWDVWSGKTGGSSSAWLFQFRLGSDNWRSRKDAYNLRGFAVRSRE